MNGFWNGFGKCAEELPKTTISEGAAMGAIPGGLIGAIAGKRKGALRRAGIGAVLGATYGSTSFARNRLDKKNKRSVEKLKKRIGEDNYNELASKYWKK